MSLAKTSAKQSTTSLPTKAAKPSPVNQVSSAFEHVAFQLIEEPASPTVEETEDNSAAADAIEDESPYGVIIEDGLPIGDGQFNRTAFMDDLAPAIESTADELLRPEGRTARDCPYLTFWVDYYRKQSAAHLERAIAHYVRPGRTDLEGIKQAILDHVGEAVQAWIDRRELQVPGPIDGLGGDGVPDLSSDGAMAQRMGADGTGAPAAPGSATAIRSQLTAGRPLESTVRSRMERGFGTSFDEVRIYTDGTASRLAHSFSARAFTVGSHIAFAGGLYRPDNIVGTALLAHELAHVVQQRAGSRSAGVADGADTSLEANANDAAESVVRSSLHLQGGGAGARVRTGASGGLRLQRCSNKESPKPAPKPSPEDEMRVVLTEVLKDHAIEPAEWQRVNERATALNVGEIAIADLTREESVGGLSSSLSSVVALLTTGKGNAFSTLRSEYRSTYAPSDDTLTPSPIPVLLKAALADSSLDFEELDGLRTLALRGTPDYADLRDALTKANIAPAAVNDLMQVVDISGVAWKSLSVDPVSLPLRFTSSDQGSLNPTSDLRIVLLRALAGDGTWSSLEFPKIRALLRPLGRAGAKKLLTDAGFETSADQLAKQFTADAGVYSQRMPQDIRFKREGNKFALETPWAIEAGKGPSAGVKLQEESIPIGDYSFRSGLSAPAIKRNVKVLGKDVPVICPNREEDFFIIVRGAIIIDQGVASIPTHHLALIRTLVLDPGDMTDAAADANRDGVVNLYMGGTGRDSRELMIHEVGHLVSFKADVADSGFWTKWNKAAEKDSAAVSLYGTTNQFEDFAEAYLLFIINQKKAEKDFPSRSELIQPLVHPAPQKAVPSKP